MNNIILNEKIKIEDMIYEIRGKQIMLDSDLAKLYECKNGTKEINQAVKNNLEKFPERFSWQLTEDELKYLRSKFLTTNYSNMSRSMPRVFTEQGVAMLATILHTSVATEISIRIMDAFVAMRRYISQTSLEQNFINNLVLEDHEKIKVLENLFQKFDKEKVNDIYFNGQNYDAYYRIQEIFNKTKKNLIVIDSYADNKILDIIKRIKVNVVIITKENNLLTKQDIDEYNKQYNNLKVIYNNTFHDRYFIIDDNKIYHCGASVNRIGNKTFSINLITDNEVNNLLLNKVKKLIEGK